MGRGQKMVAASKSKTITHIETKFGIRAEKYKIINLI